ncbi:PIN domain-containing protein [Desulforhopalus singaporensis]|uniref:PIN-like domain-containing protein n=1 Tax=Desulforhopalus singaporensis TaxID=91360 RepID=A0A1H0U4V4_9BACT|nr:PIN domain-containing protein [Desulforhopalus singaporensis]SDP61307.1 hypothetical protein SAMN05660330_03381 [Desulforhopalus singaporensis]
MSTNYVLIDLENVQPKNLNILLNHPFKIFVFVGENQAKIPFDLASVMQEFGGNARYLKISGNGKNSLDFHLAYYLGKLSTEDPAGYYHIISKDTGFDPLVKHLKKNKIRIHRHSDLAEIPLLRISNTTNIDEKIDAVIKNLAGRGQSRPRKIRTLSNTINSLFSEKLNDPDMKMFIKTLITRKYVAIDGEKVSYHLSKID